MKITYATTPSAQAVLRAEPGEYDAYPMLRELIVDAVPRMLLPDRKVLAGYLAFGRYISGRLESSVRCSPAMAEAIREDSQRLVADIAPIEYYPKGLSQGFRRLRLRTSFADTAEHAVTVVPSGWWNGALRGGSDLIVASNANMLVADERDIRPLLAAAMLFCDDLEIDTLAIDSAGIPEAEQIRLVELVAASGLGLSFVD